MRIAVTGAGGYVGGALVNALATSDADEVVAFSRPGGTACSFPPGIVHMTVDLADCNATADAFQSAGADAVVHAAAAVFSASDAESAASGRRDNICGTASLLDAASKAGISCIVLLSSISVYGNTPLQAHIGFTEDDPIEPIGEYGRQKAEAERLAMDWQKASPDRHLVTLRLAGVHGGRRKTGVVYRMIQSAKAGTEIHVMEPNSRFSFLHIDDAVNAVRNALSVLPHIDALCLNVAGGEQLTLTELATAIIRKCQSDSRLVLGDGPSRVSALSIDKAHNIIGFSPTPINDWVAAECRAGSLSGDRP